MRHLGKAREKVNLVVKRLLRNFNYDPIQKRQLGPLSTSFFPASLSTFCLVQCSVASQGNVPRIAKHSKAMIEYAQQVELLELCDKV